MTESICPICRHPKTANNEGRLTQWMLTCRCDRPLTETEEAVVVNLCRTCGKRVGEGRAGSLTQFIFRFDTCTCEHPNPEMRNQVPAGSGQEFSPVNELDDGEELSNVDEGFPCDRYKPLEILGSGASGVVYLANDRLLKKLVAVKVLRNLAATQLVSFQEEARTTSRLKHQNIVEVGDFAVSTGGAPYMVLEYVDGISLRNLIEREGPLSYIACIPLFQQICEGLEYAHAHGIFHRDIKPSNILLSEDAEGGTVVRLIDFGLASVMNEEKDIERGLTLAGTPYYMSPDQARNKTFDERSEVYGLGCVLFEALTGLPPFRGTTALETLSMHAELVPPSLVEGFNTYLEKEPHTYSEREPHDVGDEFLPVLREFPPGQFPRALETIVSTCLAKNPADRFQSMYELNSALTDLYSAIDSDLYSTSATDNDAAMKETSENREGASEGGSQFLSRSKIPLVAVLVTVALLGFGVIGFLIFDTSVPPRPVSETGSESNKASVEANSNLDSDHRKSPLSLFKTSVTDLNLNASLGKEFAKDLKQYKNLMSLDLSNNDIDDEVTSYVNGKRLNHFDLSNTNVRTLEYVAKMPNVENLNVAGSKVDNEAIKRVSRMHLNSIDIRETQVDDEVVEMIARMPCLAAMGIARSKVSEKGIERLLYLRPELVTESYEHEAISLSDPKFLPGNRPKNLNILEKELRRAIALISERRGKDDAHLAHYYWFLSGVCLDLGKQKEFDELVDKSLELASKYNIKPMMLAACTKKLQDASSKKDWKNFVRYGSRTCELQYEINASTEGLVEQIFTVSDTAWNIKNEQESTKMLMLLLAVTKELEDNSKLTNKMRATYIAWSYMRLGSRAEAKNNLEDAESYYRKAIAAFRSEEVPSRSYFPDLANTYRTLAAMCFANGKLEDAVKFDEKAVTIYKNEHMDDYYNQTLKMLEFHQEKLRESLARKAI